eukprot:683731-Rhodomonas_salina.1
MYDTPSLGSPCGQAPLAPVSSGPPSSVLVVTVLRPPCATRCVSIAIAPPETVSCSFTLHVHAGFTFGLIPSISSSPACAESHVHCSASPGRARE